MDDYLFTSESVAEGHPDKVADKISDAVLDDILSRDPEAHVAAETLVNAGAMYLEEKSGGKPAGADLRERGLIVLAGEISTAAADKSAGHYADIARKTVRDLGYNQPDLGFNGDDCTVLVSYKQQSPDIARGVNKGTGADPELGAGDQGLMFGYACDETATLMPFSIYYAHRLMERQAELRQSGYFPWLRPDAKSQVTTVYDGNTGQPKRIKTIVFSTQHAGDIAHKELAEFVHEEIIKKVIPARYLTDTDYFINPTGQFIIGGPKGDCGLTGRKIIVDTYGGAAPHGGGAFSGKDATKVDRSASYACRYIAKNIVAAGLARQCQLQVSYTIGRSQPNSLSVDTFGTSSYQEADLLALVKDNFDLRPQGIIDMLQLRRPIFTKTVNYGHFGRELPEFTWEKTDKAALLKAALKAN